MHGVLTGYRLVLEWEVGQEYRVSTTHTILASYTGSRIKEPGYEATLTPATTSLSSSRAPHTTVLWLPTQPLAQDLTTGPVSPHQLPPHQLHP